MKLLVISDIHGAEENLSLLEGKGIYADIVLVSGDLTAFGNRGDAELIAEKCARLGGRVLAVPGNCDPQPVTDCLEEAGISLHEKVLLYKGCQFAGIGGSLPGPMDTPTIFPEVSFDTMFGKLSDKIDSAVPLILVTHQPAHGSPADRFKRIKHVGSRTVRKWVDIFQPILAVSGHIHESVCNHREGNIRFINPGALIDGRYGIAEIDGSTITAELKRLF